MINSPLKKSLKVHKVGVLGAVLPKSDIAWSYSIVI